MHIYSNLFVNPKPSAHVAVIPGTPRMQPLTKGVSEGDDVELTCRANLGRPVGKVIWSRQRIGKTQS